VWVRVLVLEWQYGVQRARGYAYAACRCMVHRRTWGGGGGVHWGKKLAFSAGHSAWPHFLLFCGFRVSGKCRKPIITTQDLVAGGGFRMESTQVPPRGRQANSRSQRAIKSALRALSSPWHLREQVAMYYWESWTGRPA
jgi:hypothetical protein